MHTDLRELESALTTGEFFLEYLPIVDLDSNVCVGAEALTRWQRGNEVVPPSEFIPTIENTPLSGLHTYWVIETVAEEMGDWMRATDQVFISVNIPPELIGRGGVRYVVVKSGLSDVLDKLVLEITERGVPDDLGIRTLHETQRHGVRVCLDDVGASDENLILLVRANVDMVKFDKSFTSNILDPNWSSDSMNGLVAIARTTTIQLVAEGIETPLQRDRLREAGVQMGQGWHFSHPLSAAAFFEFHRCHQEAGGKS